MSLQIVNPLSGMDEFGHPEMDADILLTFEPSECIPVPVIEALCEIWEEQARELEQAKVDFYLNLFVFREKAQVYRRIVHSLRREIERCKKQPAVLELNSS